MSGAVPPPPLPPPPRPVPSGAANRGSGRRETWIALAVVAALLVSAGAVVIGSLPAGGKHTVTSSGPSSTAQAVPPLGSFSGDRVPGFPPAWRRWTLTNGALSIMAPPYPTLGGDSVQSQSARFQGDDAMWLTVLTVIGAHYPSVSAATANFPSSSGPPERIHVNGVLGFAYSFRSQGSQVEMWVFLVDGNFYEIVGSYPFGSPTTPTARHEAKLCLGSLELIGSAGN